MSIRWENISDWDNSQDSSGTNHGNDPYTSSTPDKLKQGYEKQWPPMTHGLVGWWPLHTDKPVDLSGNNNHGTLNGGVTTGVAGRGGLQATSFDGTDDYVEIGSVYSSDPITASIWVRKPDTTSGHTFLSQNRRFELAYESWGNDGYEWRAYDGSSEQIITSGVHTTDEWVLLTATYDGSTTTLYVNDTEAGSINAGTAFTSDGWTIGRTDGVDELYADGSIGGARLYNRVLSASEIQTLYEWGSADLAQPPTDGVARYALDGDATDSWGNNDGTNNGVTFTNNAIRGQAGEFESSNNDHIDTNNDFNSFVPAGSSMTLSFWVKSDSMGSMSGEKGFGQGDYDGSNPGNENAVIFFNDADGNQHASGSRGLVFRVRHGENSSGDRTQLMGPQIDNRYNSSWLHNVLVIDSSNDGLYWYINGEITDHEENWSGGMPNIQEDHFTDSSLLLGAAVKPSEGSGTKYWKGQIDDVRIYDRALTPSEIQELYRWGTKGVNMSKYTVMQ